MSSVLLSLSLSMFAVTPMDLTLAVVQRSRHKYHALGVKFCLSLLFILLLCAARSANIIFCRTCLRSYRHFSMKVFMAFLE